MSRPLRLLLPVACVVLSLGLNACVGTVYDRMYTNKKSHFRPPAEKKQDSAEAILGAVDEANASSAQPTEAVPGLAPLGGEIPGLPPAMPDAPPLPPPVPGL